MVNSIKPSSNLNSQNSQIVRKYIPTGGTIVGKTTPNGGYIAGALTASEQEALVSDAINKRNHKTPVKINTIGQIDAGGSQNITGKDISKLYRIISEHMQTPPSKNGGILITAGTDKSELLVHSLQMLIPNPSIPIVITAAMCPPGGVKSGLGNYEDGPVNLRNSELLLEHLEQKGIKKILLMMEDKAYQGGNVVKKRPYGIEGAFGTRSGHAPFKLQSKQAKSDFVSHSGDTKSLIWTRDERGKLVKPDKNTAPSFDTYIDTLLNTLESEGDLGTAIITETGQGNITKTIKALAQDHHIIGYRGVGNGNINEKDCVPLLENLITEGKHVFVRGSSADGAEISNIGGEAKNVEIFSKQFPDKHYRLTDFMVPQGHYNTKDATRIIGMIHAMGYKPPQRDAHKDLATYLDQYKGYIKELTKCVNSNHPLICAARILDVVSNNK